MKRMFALLFVVALVVAATASIASAGRYSSGCNGVNDVAYYHGEGWHGTENSNISACD